MVNTIFILDKTFETSHILVSNKNSQKIFWDDTFTLEFDTFTNTFEFSCYSDDSIVLGNYVTFEFHSQFYLFTIMDVEEEHIEGRIIKNVYCENTSLSLLNNYVRSFEGDMNCIAFFQYILTDTMWAIGKYNTSLNDIVKTVKITSATSVWKLIQDYADIFGCELNTRATFSNGRITGLYIDIYAEKGLGNLTYKRFEYAENVVGITKQTDLNDFCTSIIIEAECDVNSVAFSTANGDEFDKTVGSDVILHPNANRIYNAGKNYIMGVYKASEENEKTDPRLACMNAWKELKKRSEPHFNYEVTTALTSEEFREINIGDTVHVIDMDFEPELLLEARIGKLQLSFTDSTKNKCELTNYKEIKSKLLSADYVALTGTITDIVDTYFPITSEGIAPGAIVDGHIDTVYYQQITADIVSASKVVAEELIAKEIIAIEGKFEEIESGSIKTEDLEAINATIENLKVNKAEIKDLDVLVADIDVLEADVASINTLLNGQLTSENIHSLNLTSAKVTVEDAFIKDAMIDNISANKITTGQLNTNVVKISSQDGSMTLQGNLQQFKDSQNRVRIQIGKDNQGQFTFCLFSQDGKGVLIDENGLHEGAIGEGLIVDSMVSDNANIQGNKLDINSVITSINGSTSTIKSSKIYFDDEEQSLEVLFNQLKTKVENFEDINIEGDLSSIIETVSSNTSSISLMQGKIETLIANTTIVKEGGQTVQLKDELNSVKDTVNSHTQKIAKAETNIEILDDNNKVQVEGEDGTIQTITLKESHSQLTQDLGGFKLEVSENVASQTANIKDEIQSQLGEDFATREELESLTSTVSSSIEQTSKQIEFNFTETSKLVSNIEGKMNEQQVELDKYIRFGVNGIELGETGSSFKATLDNQKLAFLENGESVAFISNKALNITHANIIDSLQVGQFRFLPRDNGNLSFTWVEGTNVSATSVSEINEVIEIEEGDEE